MAMVNPKKQIMKFLRDPHDPACGAPHARSEEVLGKVQQIREGMSDGTATLIIHDAVSEKYAGDFPVADLVNRGRYYTARLIDSEGNTIERLLVDKQTGEVRFV